MKTLQELYKEVLASEELKKSFAEAMQNGTAADFLKANGCETSAEELAAFLKEQQAKTGELSDEELDSVSGGCNQTEALWSMCTAGIACFVLAIESDEEGGRKGPDGRILCCDENLTRIT